MVAQPEQLERAKPTLVFFPWVALETSARPLGIDLRIYDADDSSWSDDVRQILSAYHRCAGQKVETATILAFDGTVGGSLTDGQVEAAFAFREAVSFAALRQREFFSGSKYFNDHTFTCVAQSYVPGSPGATAISRRRDGRSMTYLGVEYHQVICPNHVAAESNAVLDSATVAAIMAAIADPRCDWLTDGIELFNLANTDSPLTRTHQELVLIVAAAQRLLGVEKKSDAQGLAQQFAASLYAGAPAQLDVADSARLAGTSAKSLAEAWFYDVYSDRGPVSHGRPKPGRNRHWTRDEHLLLAAYILPRIALARLADVGHYNLTQSDKDELGAFDYLLCLNDVFGSGEDGATGLPERFHPRSRKFAWNTALDTGIREQEMKRFLFENNLDHE